jgi:hypothetical protein
MMLRHTKCSGFVLCKTTNEPQDFGTILILLDRSDIAVVRPQRITVNWKTLARMHEMACSTHSVICRAALFWTTMAARSMACVPVAESEACGLDGVAWNSEPCANTSQQDQTSGRKRGQDYRCPDCELAQSSSTSCMIGNEGSSPWSDVSHVISRSGSVK